MEPPTENLGARTVEINLEAVKPARRARPRKTAAGPAAPPAPAAPPEPAENQPSPEEIKQSLLPIVPALYYALGQIEALVAAKATGLDFERCQPVFSYEAELELLRDPTAAVIAKHSNGLAKHADELRLAILLTSVHLDKIQRLRSLSRERSDLRPPAPGKVDAQPGAGAEQR